MGGALALFTGVCSLPAPQYVTVSLNRGGAACAFEHVELQWRGGAQPSQQEDLDTGAGQEGAGNRQAGRGLNFPAVMGPGWFSNSSVMGQDMCLRSIFLAVMRREGSRELDERWRTEKQATKIVQKRGSRNPG